MPEMKIEREWNAQVLVCPTCKRAVVRLTYLDVQSNSRRVVQVWPKGVARAPLSSIVPEEYASDYREACLVLGDSPKASAALSRRCLQNLLRGTAGVNPGDLAKEISQAMPTLPSHLADGIDAVRNIGNFAAHPMKSNNTGEVVDVEPGETEWLLDILEGLFDHYFVQPALLSAKRDARTRN